eukprot:6554954-Pyramimonas_sp.AAC.1
MVREVPGRPRGKPARPVNASSRAPLPVFPRWPPRRATGGLVVLPHQRPTFYHTGGSRRQGVRCRFVGGAFDIGQGPTVPAF